MKYINADKLLNKLLKETDLSKSYLIRVIDELSEEREEYEVSKDIDFIQPFKTKTYKVKPTYLKVAIKGDGTEEYGKKIIDYFEKLGGINIYLLKGIDKNTYYFVSDLNKTIVGCYELREGYIEISLKEEEKEPNCDLINNEIQKRLKERFGGLQYDLEKRVEAIEQKLKKLSE